ncbi:MAG: hypothetical protein R8P61_05805 [Bacteroidia bacterium]|nr:hypothetical protein [Bacteroidia bacterium]
MNCKLLLCCGYLLLFFLESNSLFAQKSSKFKSKEKKGFVRVEAEHFNSQVQTDKRRWYVVKANSLSLPKPDPDDAHYSTASSQAYLEILPDTRRTHDDPLVVGESFSNEAGQMAILSYRIKFKNPGKYFVWVKAYSTGTEDNGIHVGLDGNWPESGQRMQWCEGKQKWTWESKQRTEANHCGEAQKIFIEVETPGWHEVMFSMREDGFEFDAFVLSQKYEQPLD